MFNRLTVPNIILFVGFLLSETCVLYHFVDVADLKYYSWIQDEFFYLCTLIQVFAFISYLNLTPLKYYSHVFQFIVLPFFSINFMKQGHLKDKLLINSIRLIVFLLGWVLCFLMILTQYTRYTEDESESLMKISTNLRILKLLKRLLFVIIVGLQILMDKQVVFMCMLVLSVLELYIASTTFTFQNPFHEYMVLIMSFAAVVSWIDFTFYVQGFSSYSYIGEILYLLITFIQPQIFQKVLQFKYQFFGDKNIETRQIHEILGFFVVMKEIILNQHKNFNYTQDFDNKIHVLLQRMVIRNKIEPYQIYEDQTLEDKDFLNGDQVTFLRLLQKKLIGQDDFLVNEFYLNTLIRKSLPFQKKALKFYYERQADKNKTSSNIFSRIQMHLLYQNLIKRIEAKKGNQLHHETLLFCDHLNQLKRQILTLCKHQISFVNLLQNSLNVPIENYSQKMIQRYQMKRQVKAKIDQLVKNQWHIHSGDFIYITLLYKIIFQREKLMIKEKMTKNFVIPLALENRKNKDQIEEKKNVGIVVFSSKQKGEIINENEMFAKMFGKTVRSGQKSRKYIGQLFPSIKQKLCHQQQMDSIVKQNSVQIQDHGDYECWISRKVLKKESRIRSDSIIICTVQKFKISTRIYYEMRESEAFICVIEPLEDDVGIKVLTSQIKNLEKRDIQIQVLKTFKVTQLNELMQINHILIKEYQDQNQDSDFSDHITMSNISENLMLNPNIQTSHSKKILKIEKQYDKEQIQPNSRRILVFAALIFPLMALLIDVGVFAYQEKEIQKSNDILQSQKTIFEYTILNEKYVGLHLILLQLVDQNIIQHDICNKFQIPNLKNYAVSNLQNYALNNFDQIQIKQIQGIHGDKDIMNLMSSKFYRFFDLRDPGIQVDYVKYGGLTKSAIFEYASTIGEVTLDNWCKKSIQKVINLSEIDKNGLYSNLRSLFEEKINYLTQTIQYSIIFLIISNSITFSIVLYIFYILINFKYSHIKLLKGFRKPFIQGRVRQMDFILAEMSKLDKKQIVDVSISKNMTISMQKHNQQKVMDLNELEKESYLKIIKNGGNSSSSKSISMKSSSYIEDEKQRLLDVKNLHEEEEQKNTLLLVFSFHKNKAIVLFCLFVIVIILNIFHIETIKQRSVKNIKMEDTFDEMSRLFVSMNDLLIGEVIKLSDQQQYLSKEQNEKKITRALDEVESNKFKHKVFGLFPKNLSDFILYSSYCREAPKPQICKRVKSKVLNNGLSSITAFLPADYNSTWNNRLSRNMRKIQQNQVCEKLVIFMNYTVKMLPKNLIVGYKTIQEDLMGQQKQLKVAEIVIYLVMIVGIVIMAEVIIGRGRKVRCEALSMDTKHNLYEYSERYKPILNRMYYREDQDDIE